VLRFQLDEFMTKICDLDHILSTRCHLDIRRGCFSLSTHVRPVSRQCRFKAESYPRRKSIRFSYLSPQEDSSLTGDPMKKLHVPAHSAASRIVFVSPPPNENRWVGFANGLERSQRSWLSQRVSDLCSPGYRASRNGRSVFIQIQLGSKASRYLCLCCCVCVAFPISVRKWRVPYIPDLPTLRVDDSGEARQR
jgi:hypothetical protein